MNIFLVLLSGFSTFIGLIFIVKEVNKNIIPFMLSLSASVMVTLSIIELIPEAFKLIGTTNNNFITILYILIFINIGFILVSLTDKIGVSNKLYKLGIINFIVLAFHNILEGMIMFLSTISSTIKYQLFISIILHNIPEGASIAVPIYYGTKNKLKTVYYVFIASISELIGYFICFIFFKDIINDFMTGLIFSLTAGLMIYISIFELFKEAFTYKTKLKYLGIIIGSVIMILSMILIG